MKNRILVIDDDAIFRELVRTILTSKGFVVEEASDGKEGMKAVHSSPLDIVITDIFMPEQDGFEVIRKLRQEFPEERGGLRVPSAEATRLACCP